MSAQLHAAEAGPVPVEALAWFRRKGLRPGFSYLDVWREEHAYAFTAAKVMREDVLAAMRDEIARALEEGLTYEQFRRQIEQRLVSLGWWGKQPVRDPVTGRVVEVDVPSRLHRIFSTNMRTARAAGQWHRIERTRRTHPYLVYLLGPSREHRPEHVEWAGTVLPVDHPWWDTHFPPNGWGCKCWVRQISERTLERLRTTGVRQLDGSVIPIKERPPAVRTVVWVNPRTGIEYKTPEGIDPGWDYNFGKVRPAADGSPTPEGAPTPAERRRSQLEALGLPEDAIARDLAELPPPPETTREGLRDWARGLSDIALSLDEGRPLSDDQARRLRVGVRRLMRAHSTDLFSRDVQRNQDGYGLRVEYLGERVNGAHDWRGRIYLPPKMIHELARAIRAMSGERRPTDDGWNALHTLFHEELHGHSPVTKQAYTGHAKGAEEATVETLARALIQRVFASWSEGRPGTLHPKLGLPSLSRDRGGVRLDPSASTGGAYQGWVNGLHVATHRVTGLTGEELTQRIVSALERTHFALDTTTIEDEAVYLDRVASAIAPEAASAMREELTAVMIPTLQWTEAPGWR